MTRFTKEMVKKFHGAAFCEDDFGEKSAFCVESESLVVLCHPSLIIVLRIGRDGSAEDVTEDFPQYSAPYLVHLCGGDLEQAREILKSNYHF